MERGTHACSPLPGNGSVGECFSRPSPKPSPRSTALPPLGSSRTHLCDLVQQFVVFLPFLQGAQIATHPSCQGNGSGYPTECVLRVLPPPPGVENTLPRLPHSSFSSVRPQGSLGSAASAGHALPQKLKSCVSGPLPSLPVTPFAPPPDSSSCMPTYAPLSSLLHLLFPV